jgi:uncharacterized OB-fold protein
MTQEQPRVLKGKITLPYQWALGPTNSRFFDAFQEKRIMGTRCAQCERVLVPARSFCSRCFLDVNEWVQVMDEGTLRTWVLINFPYADQPKEPPYIIGVIDLEGADTSFTHFVGGLDSYEIDDLQKTVRIGMRVKALWSEKREGNIFDIAYFKPAD